MRSADDQNGTLRGRPELGARLRLHHLSPAFVRGPADDLGFTKQENFLLFLKKKKKLKKNNKKLKAVSEDVSDQ